MNRKHKMYTKSIILLLMIIDITTFPLTFSKEKTTYTPQIEIDEPPIIKHTLKKMVDKPSPKVNVKNKVVNKHETINTYIRDVCSKYNVEPELVMSIVYHESRYRPTSRNGNCVGLMQVSMHWHKNRALKLGVTNFYDPYSNILLGVDYLSELFKKYKDPALVLMVYNMKEKDAIKMYRNGKVSNYAKSVLAMAKRYKKGE